jgi:pantetheine-phosphate adenylyltransferase
MAPTHKRLDADIETLFMMPTEGLAYVSSSMVREILRYGGDVSEFVTPGVAAELEKNRVG